jgi:hypothetical protein
MADPREKQGLVQQVKGANRDLSDLRKALNDFRWQLQSPTVYFDAAGSTDTITNVGTIYYVNPEISSTYPLTTTVTPIVEINPLPGRELLVNFWGTVKMQYSAPGASDPFSLGARTDVFLDDVSDSSNVILLARTFVSAVMTTIGYTQYTPVSLAAIATPPAGKVFRVGLAVQTAALASGNAFYASLFEDFKVSITPRMVRSGKDTGQ